MGISFNCEHCGKKIEAPDKAGGKWGRCPSCHNKVYVPGLDEDQELKLAPMDQGDVEKQKQLMAETYRFTQDILRERENPNEPAESIAMPVSQMSDEQFKKEIISYLRQMADGQLIQAERVGNLIVSYGDQSVGILDGIALSEMPEPELADVPPQGLSGLIRTLRARIG